MPLMLVHSYKDQPEMEVNPSQRVSEPSSVCLQCVLNRSKEVGEYNPTELRALVPQYVHNELDVTLSCLLRMQKRRRLN